jgi:hypothetical protein
MKTLKQKRPNVPMECYPYIPLTELNDRILCIAKRFATTPGWEYKYRIIITPKPPVLHEDKSHWFKLELWAID